MKRTIIAVILLIGFTSGNHSVFAGTPTPYAAIHAILLPRSAFPSYFLASNSAAVGSDQWGGAASYQSQQFNLPVGHAEGGYGVRVNVDVTIFSSVAEAQADVKNSRKGLDSSNWVTAAASKATTIPLGSDAFIAKKANVSPNHSALTFIWRHGFIEVLWQIIATEKELGSRALFTTFVAQVTRLNNKSLWVSTWKVPVAQY